MIKKIYSSVLGAGWSQIKAQADLVSAESPLLVHRKLPSHALTCKWGRGSLESPL